MPRVSYHFIFNLSLIIVDDLFLMEGGGGRK